MKSITITFTPPDGKFCANKLANIICKMHGDKDDESYCFAFQSPLDQWNPFFISKCAKCLEAIK